MKDAGSITTPRGFRAAGSTCGIKPSGQPDVALIVSEVPCAVAGVFTTNRCPGAPVVIGRRHVRGGRARAIVCNSGIANVATGDQGLHDAVSMCERVAGHVGCPVRHVVPCSTGVIGHRLPMAKIARGIDAAAVGLARGPAADAAAACAILTTDLVPKQARATVRLGAGPGGTVRLGGVAKGSGMIAPNMATMLCFITTDAAVTPPALRAALKQAVSQSFNRTSVDSDTSTSDTVLVLASGAAGRREIKKPGRAFDAFSSGLTDLCMQLAYQIVRDGEGATKVMRVTVRGAHSTADADRIGRAIVNSPLVKTALHGADPNWGRLVMAVGKSGARVAPEKLSIAIADVVTFRRGVPAPLDSAARRKLVRALSGDEVAFDVNVGIGRATAQWLGCDLSKQYVAINAEYTT